MKYGVKKSVSAANAHEQKRLSFKFYNRVNPDQATLTRAA